MSCLGTDTKQACTLLWNTLDRRGGSLYLHSLHKVFSAGASVSQFGINTDSGHFLRERTGFYICTLGRPLHIKCQRSSSYSVDQNRCTAGVIGAQQIFYYKVSIMIWFSLLSSDHLIPLVPFWLSLTACGEWVILPLMSLHYLTYSKLLCHCVYLVLLITKWS